jgi:CDP-diacylglycerol--serine O-phosphatidyltransferase
MKMRGIAVLPALVTLGNAVCGFISMAIVAKAPPANTEGGTVMFLIAGYLIFLAMVFDALDGRVARFARATSDFGGQLDSLSDAISFGAAPALLAYRIFFDATPFALSEHAQLFQRLTMAMGAAFFGCTILRLARFNVENVHDEEAHLTFRGLPSPAAAGALVSIAILILSIWQDHPRDHRLDGVTSGLVWALPAIMLALGLLMVSTIRYRHLVNQVIRGRRPLIYIVLIILALFLAILMKEQALAPLFVVYSLSGPVTFIFRKLTHAGRVTQPSPTERPHEPPRA